MNPGRHNAVAGAFENRETAHSCDDALSREGFAHRWIALTKSVESDDRIDDAIGPAPEAAPDEARFVSDEGSSLRSSLEDHGIETHEAIAIEESLVVGEAVIVVAAHDRSAAATSIIRRSGGRVYGPVRETETST